MSTRGVIGAAKHAVRSTVNRLGFDVVRLRNSHADLSTHLANVLAASEIDCVLDVGANAGQYGSFLRDLGFKGHIVSFEPVRAVYERLRSTAASDSKWHCFHQALGDRDERKTINVYASTVFSSFLSASEYSKSVWKSLDQATPEEVEVARLDSVFDKIANKTGAHRFYLKMDTQGYDRNVFDGAAGVLASIHALQSELSLIPVYNQMPAAYDVLNAYHAAGFLISGMYPINRDEKTLAVVEYDCVLVRGHVEARAA
jgi:FkbM family methyltransferase